VGKNPQLTAAHRKASIERDGAGPKQLFNVLSDRLTLSDPLKDQLISLSATEHLVQAQTMTAPPRSAAEREFFGQLLWANVCGRFKQALSAGDLRLWGSPPADVRSSPAHLRLLKSFDDFLLTQFRHWGPALFMSHGVLQRIFEWRRHDPHRMELLGAELKLNSRVVCGEAGARFPISQDLGAFKREAVKELRILFSRIRTDFSSKNRTPALIADWVEHAAKHQPGVFPSLHRSLPQLKSFLLVGPEHLVLGIVTGRTRAPSFVDTWIASATGYSVQRARQAMSRSRLK
jgi:hypothetical protein